ncbi:MAG: S8 family serine peptidase [Kaiparowitsia implicata GSE-PSE-MK54-09C]|jgi:N-acetyl-anhydromuramyl-L-alanine amidase AmpD|nr:S8 family serine peptidase [Kaiparowitsia implicata GSE-PSE-MK54-09C]
MDPALWELLEAGDQADEVAAIIRLEQPNTIPQGVRIVSQFGTIATCRMSRGSIPTIWADGAIASVKASRLLTPEPSINLEEQLPVSEQWSDRRRPSLPETGRGMVIGVVDWGFDFAHPDLCQTDGTTRILALWDQRSRPHQIPVQPYGYGVVYNQSQIDHALQTANPYQTLGYHPAEVDTKEEGAHGTHVASIAGGNGRGGGPVGVAPEAAFVLVHMSSPAFQKHDNLGNSVSLLEAVDFIAKIAGDRPWVINLSMGRHGEPHDGTTLVEQGLDAIVSGALGRAIVQSTGNYYDRRIHTQGQLRLGQTHSFTWHVDPADITPNQLEIWYSGKDTFEIELRSPNGVLLPTAPLGERTVLQLGDQTIGKLYHRRHEPNNHDHQIQIFLYTTAPPGDWQVRLRASDWVDGRFHAWIERDVALPGCQSHFAPEDAVSECTTGTICNGFRTIAVGAYNPHLEDRPIAPFSSSGPIRDGREKPDLAAPGVAILAARSAPRHAAVTPLLTRKSGTSMAAPHVTGTIALMFEAAQHPLPIVETRRLLLSNAEVPDQGRSRSRLGHGYLDIAAAVMAARDWGDRPQSPSSCRSPSSTLRLPPLEVVGMATDVSDIQDAVLDTDIYSPSSFDDSAPLGLGAALQSPEEVPTGVDAVASTPDWAVGSAPNWTDDLDNDWNELNDDGTVLNQEGGGVLGSLVDLAESIVHGDRLDPRAESISEWGDLWTELMARIYQSPSSDISTSDLFECLGHPAALNSQPMPEITVIASPRTPLEQPLQPGDVLLRHCGETHHTHAAVLATGELYDPRSLHSSGWEMEAAGAGYYAAVVETGAIPHCTHHPYARRIADAQGYLPYGQMVVRLQPPDNQRWHESDLDLSEATTTIPVIVRNRILNHETVSGCPIELVGTAAPTATTNRAGRATLDLAGLADGVYRLRAIHPSSTPDRVGPAIAPTAPRPSRIWRPFETEITVTRGRLTAVGSADAVLAGRTLTLKLQPVWMASPNRSARSETIDLCVVHHTGGTRASSAVNTFLSPNRASAHYVIDTDGQIIKMVHESEQAFHAGNSHWLGRDRVNAFSVGIEIVNRSAPYTSAQMPAVVALLQEIRAAYSTIPANQVVGHSDIATSAQTPRRLGRKASDPGVHFDWATLEAAGLGHTLSSGPLNPSAYGGFFTSFPDERLRQDDNDARQIVGGRHRPAFTTAVIAELQTDLSQIGYYCPITGRFDVSTVMAVRMFQDRFFSGSRRRSDPAFRAGQVDSITAMAIKNVR